MNKHTPPKILLRFFRWYCHPDFAEDIEGDLTERFEKRAEEESIRSAKWGFTKDVIRLFRPGIIKSLTTTQKLTQYDMFKNYFKVGIRNILKYKTFSFINIFGLAVAMAVGLLIVLMLSDQKQYDQFHAKKDLIYRVVTRMPNKSKANASSPVPLATSIKQNYPIVEEVTQLLKGVGGDVISLENQKTVEVRGFFADPAFFDVFSFDLVEGEKNKSLNNPNSMIISLEVANHLFKNENPIGKTIQFSQRRLDNIKIDLGTETGTTGENWGDFTIAGVVNNETYKSHIKFDVLVSASSLPLLYKDQRVPDLTGNWENHSSCFSYFLLQKGADPMEFQRLLDKIAVEEYPNANHRKEFIAQDLNEINLGRFLGNPMTLRLPIQAYYILGFLALVVLFSACLNYTNLSIARALTRAKEIGVRKVNGASRGNLIMQFLTEAILISFLALVIANILLLLLKPAFLNLWAIKHLGFDLTANLYVYLIFISFSLLVGLVAGIYPSMILSGFSPIKVLKNINQKRIGKVGFRAALNVSQFVFSFFFIITSILLARQFQHFVDFEYGMNVDNIVNISLRGNDYQILKNELAEVPGVIGVAGCQIIPAMPNSNGRSISKPNNYENRVKAEFLSIDPDFLDMTGLKMLAGQNLQTDSETANQIIVNEYAVGVLGFENAFDALGEQVRITGEEKLFHIMGVFQDFNFQSPIMGEGKKSLVFWNRPDLFSFLNVKVRSNDVYGTLESIQSKWKAIDPIHAMSYHFYDEGLAKSHQWLGDLMSIISFIAGLAIVISCLGLLGMAIYTTERRVKEVGVRKTLGASLTQLTFLLSKSFIRLLALSLIIGAPLSYLINSLWLKNIPNRIDFGVGTILLGSAFLLILGALTIGSQIISVSKRNPVDSLRNE